MKRALPLPVFLALLAAPEAARAEDVRISTQVVFSRPSISFQSTNFGDSDPENPGAGGMFVPDAEARPGVEVRYRNYGFSFSSPRDAYDGSPRLFSSGLSDARTYYYGDAWGFEGYHRYARGFHFQDGGPSHPDMTLRSTSATLYRAAGYDSHVHRMSDGLMEDGLEPDAMFFFGLSRTRLRDDKTFFEGTRSEDSRFDVRDLSLYTASTGVGVALSSNTGGLYFDPALFLGGGVQYREWDGHPELAFNLMRANLRMRLGYRSRLFDLGAGFENDAHILLAEGDSDVRLSSFVARARLQVYL